MHATFQKLSNALGNYKQNLDSIQIENEDGLITTISDPTDHASADHRLQQETFCTSRRLFIHQRRLEKH